MPLRTSLILLLVLAAFGATACEDERLEVYERYLAVEGPIALDRHAVLLNRATEELVLLEAEGSSLRIEHHAVGRDPVGLAVTPNRATLAVLSRRDDLLTVVDIETGDKRDYPLSSAFDTIAFSPDSRYAIVYFGPSQNRPSDVLFNPNEFTVIDITADPGSADAILPRALRGFGSSPGEVHFVPPFGLGNSVDERYAMFLFDAYVTFVDLADPSFEVTVPLTLSPADSSVRPREVLFTDTSLPELQDMFVYLLADGSDDIFAIQLLPGLSDDGQIRLAPNVNQLPSGRSPRDIVQFIGPDGREKILAVNALSSDIAVIDAATANVINVPLEAPANRIHLYEAFNSRSGEVEPYALLYGEGSRQQVVSFAALLELEDRRGQAVEALNVGSPVGRLFASPIEGQAVVLGEGGAGVALLDLEQRFANPLQSSLQVSSVEVDSAGARLFATLGGSAKLNILELATSHPESLELDFLIESALWLPKSESLLAFHSSETGLVTVLDLPVPDDGASAPLPPSRSRARIYSGFMLEGVLDR